MDEIKKNIAPIPIKGKVEPRDPFKTLFYGIHTIDDV
jgi:hypothetical protein